MFSVTEKDNFLWAGEICWAACFHLYSPKIRLWKDKPCSQENSKSKVEKSKSKVEEMNMKMKMKILSIRITEKCCKKSFRTTDCLFLLAMSDFLLKNIVWSSKFESSLTASRKTCYSPKVTCNTLYKVTATEFEPTTI